jgi:hypothetical protein
VRSAALDYHLTIIIYVPQLKAIDAKDGQRLPDGSWLGERFGHIDSQPVGTVFGAGDYQRLGRQEMATSGFFRPYVTPEWYVAGVGSYSLILNNDNGASRDDGDAIFYAGCGGRLRGQNRTATQSSQRGAAPQFPVGAARASYPRAQAVRQKAASARRTAAAGSATTGCTAWCGLRCCGCRAAGS